MMMPELPEVQTTVNGINRFVVGKTITNVWTNYYSDHFIGKENIKDPAYFKYFKKQITGAKIVEARRRAKNILISLDSGQTIFVHMKMTGHFLYGDFVWNKAAKKWQPPEGHWNKTWPTEKDEAIAANPFSDPYNDHIHLMFTLDDGKYLGLSDMRTFARVGLLANDDEVQAMLAGLGLEPLEPRLSFDSFFAKLKTRPNMKVKPALLDQTLVAGFGNIYSDEVLWQADVHPESLVGNIPEERWRAIFTEGKKILKRALRYGGDSMGDYRTIDGKSGSFQNLHNVYQRDGQACEKCGAIIEKKQIGARIGRFCPNHQTLYT